MPRREPLAGCSKRPSTESPFWAVACHFNPAGWASRRHNYGVFRRHLELPLLTVELAFSGRGELTSADADIYLRVDHGDVMWQKERLLNLAIAALPRHVTHVAWLDADIVFESPGWSKAAAAELQSNSVLQVFEQVVHLSAAESALVAKHGLAARIVGHEEERAAAVALAGVERRPGMWRHLYGRAHRSEGRVVTAKGVGWAARRELIEGIRLFDRSILGGGDSAMLIAFLGDAASFYREVPARRRVSLGPTYERWAQSAFAAVGGQVGAIPGRVLHLWHGPIAERGYNRRYELLERHGFDASVDICLGRQGTWEWATAKSGLHRDVASYFRRRREDDGWNHASHGGPTAAASGELDRESD